MVHKTSTYHECVVALHTDVGDSSEAFEKLLHVSLPHVAGQSPHVQLRRRH